MHAGRDDSLLHLDLSFFTMSVKAYWVLCLPLHTEYQAYGSRAALLTVEGEPRERKI